MAKKKVVYKNIYKGINTHNKKAFNIQKRYIILIALLGIVVLISIYSFTLKDKRDLTFPEKIIKDSVVTIQNIISAPFNFIIDNINDYRNSSKIYDEYLELKENSEMVNKIIEENNELKKTIVELKELSEIDWILTEYEKINATVINRNLGYWFNTLTINKGSNDGVEKDMIVVTSKGLIGKIIKVSYITSEVKLITTEDLNSKISVGISHNESLAYGLISGYDAVENSLLVEGVTEYDDIAIDSAVVTSGLGGIYPSGILVGHVKAVEKDNYGLTKIIKVSPSADAANVRFVSVLKRLSQ